MLNTYCPGGLAADISPFDLFRFVLDHELPIYRELLQHYKKAGIPIDPEIHAAVIFQRLDLDSLRALIEHEFDFGYEFRSHHVGTCFADILRRHPTVEVFMLLFETKLVRRNTMTAFEYARSLHPDYPFFWEMHLLATIFSSSLMRDEAPVRTPRRFSPTIIVLFLKTGLHNIIPKCD